MTGLNVGSDAVDAREDYLRVRTPGGPGAIKIPWAKITAAALATKDRELPSRRPLAPHLSGPFAQDREQAIAMMHENVQTMRQTIDVLWIIHSQGQVRVMLERTGPEREALLATLRERLGDRWLGEQFTSVEIARRFGYQKMSKAPLYFSAAVVVFVFMLAVALRVKDLGDFVERVARMFTR